MHWGYDCWQRKYESRRHPKNYGPAEKAGLINVRPGVGGATLLKDPASISLLEVYNAVEVIDEGPLFHFHPNPSPRCPVGRTIEASLTAELTEAQAAMEQRLSSVSIAKILGQVC